VIASTQTDAAASQRQLLTQLGSEISVVVGTLQDQSRAAVDTQQAQVERLTPVVGETLGGVSGQVERLVATSIAVNQLLQHSIEALGRTTGDSIRGMNEGAEKLGAAAGSFADAGQQVAATIADSAQAAADIRDAAETMKATSASAQQMLGDYREAHHAFARLVGDLKQTIERAKREANLSAELTDRLEAAAAKLGHAQQQADTYLDGVSKVLEHAHQAFADSVERTLRDANRKFQGELAQAVGLLSGAIVDLGNTVETLAEHDHALARETGKA
jgi:ABC-type transporter Mla subunit MlaD